MANTPNLDLVKPAGTDKALVSVINSNSDKIDAGFGSLSDQIGNFSVNGYYSVTSSKSTTITSSARCVFVLIGVGTSNNRSLFGYARMSSTAAVWTEMQKGPHITVTTNANTLTVASTSDTLELYMIMFDGTKPTVS